MTSFEPPDTAVFEFFISVGLEIPFLASANVNWRSSTCIWKGSNKYRWNEWKEVKNEIYYLLAVFCEPLNSLLIEFNSSVKTPGRLVTQGQLHHWAQQPLTYMEGKCGWDFLSFNVSKALGEYKAKSSKEKTEGLFSGIKDGGDFERDQACVGSFCWCNVHYKRLWFGGTRWASREGQSMEDGGVFSWGRWKNILALLKSVSSQVRLPSHLDMIINAQGRQLSSSFSVDWWTKSLVFE